MIYLACSNALQAKYYGSARHLALKHQLVCPMSPVRCFETSMRSTMARKAWKRNYRSNWRRLPGSILSFMNDYQTYQVVYLAESKLTPLCRAFSVPTASPRAKLSRDRKMGTVSC